MIATHFWWGAADVDPVNNRFAPISHYQLQPSDGSWIDRSGVIFPRCIRLRITSVQIDLKGPAFSGAEQFDSRWLWLVRRQGLKILRARAPCAYTAPTIARQCPKTKPQRLILCIFKIELHKAPFGQVARSRGDIKLHRCLNTLIIAMYGDGITLGRDNCLFCGDMALINLGEIDELCPLFIESNSTHRNSIDNADAQASHIQRNGKHKRLNQFVVHLYH